MDLTLPPFIADVIRDDPYLFLFVGLIVGGETVLLPVIYAAFLGFFNIYAVLGIALLAAVLSDSGWYVVGRFLPTGAVRRLSFFKKYEGLFASFSPVMTHHGLKVLFVSKFVYGTRIIVQILSGVYRFPYFATLIVNSIGTLALLGFIVIAATIADKTIGQINIIGFRQVAFLVFIGVIITIHTCIKKIIQKRWFQR